MTNDELYNKIKSEMSHGLTQDDLVALFTRAQEEKKQQEDENKIILARECLINATLQYIKALNLGDEITDEDAAHIEKQLITIERTINLVKNTGFSFKMDEEKTKTADEILKEFLKDL